MRYRSAIKDSLQGRCGVLLISHEAFKNLMEGTLRLATVKHPKYRRSVPFEEVILREGPIHEDVVMDVFKFVLFHKDWPRIQQGDLHPELSAMMRTVGYPLFDKRVKE